ncbi:MAG TPA: sugar transferase [Gemmatimonadales bacterium]|nr:sugar transferase [Gemmatimonadales bacterium]
MAAQQIAPAVGVHRSAAHAGKRVLDVVGATLALIIASPILVLSAAAVLIGSGPPLVYRRRVVGLGGRPFDAFKLRTMVPDADARLRQSPDMAAAFQRSFKLERDPRITRVGGALRRWSLDELPQLINVLRGEMSLVGPRMITAEELPKYGAFAAELVTAKPGVSGLWQVSGRQALDYATRVRLDMEYLAGWSLLGDLWIVLRTPLAVLTRRGAH